jgi:hypothetical protein
VSRFRLSPGGKRPHEPWFHIGTLEVDTTWLVVLLSIVGIVLFAAVGSAPIQDNLELFPQSVTDLGKVWVLVTWPFAYPGLSLWAAVGIFFFWYFGRDVERNIFGRVRWAWVLLLWTLALGLILVGLYELAPQTSYGLAGISLLGIMTLLLWVAEWPNRMFFFNIPAWVIGLVYVGLNVLSYVGNRQWLLLWDFLIGIAVCGFIARQFGALGEYQWIPKLPAARRRKPKPVRSTGSGGRQASRPSGPTVVPGPWVPEVDPRDEARMNELLEKIHEHGAASLTERERAELNELRLRRRRG